MDGKCNSVSVWPCFSVPFRRPRCRERMWRRVFASVPWQGKVSENTRHPDISWQSIYSRKLNISPLKNDGTGRRSFPFLFGKVTFSGRTVKVEECTSSFLSGTAKKVVGVAWYCWWFKNHATGEVGRSFSLTIPSFSASSWGSLGFWCLKSYFCILGPTWEVVVQGIYSNWGKLLIYEFA